MLELAILGLLKEQPMHGYQLSRELGESLGGFWRVSYGSLYPSLRRLEKEGAVESVPSDEERGGRRKNVYRITEKGEKLFFELLQETPHDNSTEDTRFRCGSRSSSTCLRRPASACWNGGARSWRTACPPSRTRCGPPASGSTTTRSR